jgi:fucose permease
VFISCSPASALVLGLLVWFVNSNIGDAFSTGIFGLVCGPVFPATLSLANSLLPEEVHLVSMGLM